MGAKQVHRVRERAGAMPRVSPMENAAGSLLRAGLAMDVDSVDRPPLRDLSDNDAEARNQRLYLRRNQSVSGRLGTVEVTGGRTISEKKKSLQAYLGNEDQNARRVSLLISQHRC